MIAESPYVEMLVSDADFGLIPAGGMATNSAPLLLSIAPEVPDAERLAFTILLSEDPGARPLDLVAQAPAYIASVIAIDDAAGNGDGIADPGEHVALNLLIENVGSSDTPDLSVALGSHSPYFLPDAATQPLGVIPAGGSRDASGLLVDLAPDCPPLHAGYLSLELLGAGDYAMAFPFVFCAGQSFGDDLELDAISWSHAAGGDGWGDQWHRETYRNHTPGGTVSWKCGGPGADPYDNLLFAILETADFIVPPQAQLEFWHRIDAQNADSLPGWAIDGGLLEISSDGGESWLQIEPDGGYPYQIRPSTPAGPFPIFTPVWSGEHDWAQVAVDLSAFTGTARLRWIFGSNGYATQEGWYIDDVRVGVGWPSGAPQTPVRVSQLALLPARPNPLASIAAGGTGTELRWRVPQATAGHLALYDTAGRRVRLLASGPWTPGLQRIAWDGRDDIGRLLTAGTYYVRLEAAGVARSGKLTLIR